MFVDLPGGGPPAPPPPRRPPRVSAREERVLLWLACLCAAALFLAPFGGASIVTAVAALFR